MQARALSTLGPDLNPTRPDSDRKEYRLITLANGLECLLIQSKEPSNDSDDEDDEEEGEDEVVEDEEESSENDSDSQSDGDDDGRAGRYRAVHTQHQAAAAIAVGTGSFNDPDCCQGLAHFLEHMLFMGSEKYPKENKFDSALTKACGATNAYTDAESTVFHFACAPEQLHPILDIFSQFFISPLMLPDSVDRELQSIESEFNLGFSSDASRLQEVWCHTARNGHVYRKFGWGNLESLRDVPIKAGVDPLIELRKFYDQYYYATNMKLVVMGSEPLDSIQLAVEDSFSAMRNGPGPSYNPSARDIPKSPIADTNPFVLRPATTWRDTNTPVDQLAPVDPDVGDPNAERYALGCIFRVVPLRETHILTLSWPIVPSVHKEYKSDPSGYAAHLLGHEVKGSVLSVLKARGWANALSAGAGSNGYDSNAACTLFTVVIYLSVEGVMHWDEVIELIYSYISVLRREGVQQWVFDEEKRSQEMTYRFLEAMEPGEEVEELVASMLPSSGLAPEHYLNGSQLLFELGKEKIEAVIACLEPHNMRVDMRSSSLKPYSEPGVFTSSSTPSNAEAIPTPAEPHSSTPLKPDGVDTSSKPSTKEEVPIGLPTFLIPTRTPAQEPRFKTLFWADALPEAMLTKWGVLGHTVKNLCPEIYLPPPNPYIAHDLSLRELPAESSTHALLGASVRVREQVGKHLQWHNGTVGQFNRSKGMVKIAYEGGFDTWHKLDEPTADVYKGSTVMLGNGSVHCRVVAGPPSAPRARKIMGRIQDVSNGTHQDKDQQEDGEEEEDEDDDEEYEKSVWASFPHVPQHIASLEPVEWKGAGSSAQVRVFHLQDRMFRVPKLEVYIHLITSTDMPMLSDGKSEDESIARPAIPGPKPTHSNARAMVLTDMLLHLIQDAIIDDSYMAEIAELCMRFSRTDCGIQLQFGGFSDKLLVLLRTALSSLFMALPGRSSGANNNPTSTVDGVAPPVPPSKAKSRRRNRRKGKAGANRGEGGAQPSDNEPGPFDPTRLRNMIDSRRRAYTNASKKSPELASRLRLACLLPTDFLMAPLVRAMDEIGDDLERWTMELRRHSRLLFENCNAHVLVHGNADLKDVKALAKVVSTELRTAGAKPLTRLPARSVLVVPTQDELAQAYHIPDTSNTDLAIDMLNTRMSSTAVDTLTTGNSDAAKHTRNTNLVIVTDTHLPSSPNSSVNLYMQADAHDNLAHVTMDLIDLIMEEPLYNELRTKQQLGYSVSCGPRSTVGMLGFVVSVTSASRDALTLVTKINEFLVEFEKTLAKMPASEYAEHACSLARSKLRPYNNMSEETEGLWDQMLSRKHMWNEHLDEVSQLRNITKDTVLKAYRRWVLPGSPHRRVIDVRVQGVPRVVKKEKNGGDSGGCGSEIPETPGSGDVMCDESIGDSESESGGDDVEQGVDGGVSSVSELREEADTIRIMRLGRLVACVPQEP